MPQPPTALVASLNAEWATLRDRAPDWPCPHGATLAAVLAAVRAAPDPVLADLIAACQAGSALAGRTVVQAFLGKLILLAAGDRRIRADDAVAALWLRVARYPLDRRPRGLAVNLVLDTRKDVLAEQRDLALVPRPPEPGVTAGAVLDEARDLRLAPPANLAVAASVYADGLSGARAADRHQLTPTAVRWRCHDTVRRLRQARHLLADAGLPTHPVAWVVA